MNNVIGVTASVGKVHTSFNVVSGISIVSSLLLSIGSLITAPNNGNNEKNKWGAIGILTLFVFCIISVISIQYYFVSTYEPVAALNGVATIANVAKQII